jgi:4-hydroxy-4-methyl-2-oxoglutarate aldolase
MTGEGSNIPHARPVAGDETTGGFVPADVRQSAWPRVDRGLLRRLEGLPGLTSTASDVMDELGLPLVVAGDLLQPRLAGAQVVGQAVTLRYLPERRTSASQQDPGTTSRLAHHVAFELSASGDVLVIDATATAGVSVFGGMAALAAKRSGIGGIVVDGAIRDLDEIVAIGLPAWSRSISPRTGKWRIEATQINAPIACGGHQVVPGDLVLADATGVCFIPVELAEQAAEAILEVAGSEAGELKGTG